MAATTETRTLTVTAQPMTAEAFAPYGRVVGDQREPLQMQEGQFTARLMTVQRVPETIRRINMHTDHNQLFVPLNGDRLVVIVAPPDVPADRFDATTIAAFVTDGKQTFLFHPGTWHIEPRALDRDSCQVINVQTDVYRDHTTLIHLDEQAGVRVQLEIPASAR